MIVRHGRSLAPHGKNPGSQPHARGEAHPGGRPHKNLNTVRSSAERGTQQGRSAPFALCSAAVVAALACTPTRLSEPWPSSLGAPQWMTCERVPR